MHCIVAGMLGWEVMAPAPWDGRDFGGRTYTEIRILLHLVRSGHVQRRSATLTDMCGVPFTDDA